jgi:hypothetical protein
MNAFNFVCADPENPSKKEIFAGLMSLFSSTKNQTKSKANENQQLVRSMKDVAAISNEKQFEAMKIVEDVNPLVLEKTLIVNETHGKFRQNIGGMPLAQRPYNECRYLLQRCVKSTLLLMDYIPVPNRMHWCSGIKSKNPFYNSIQSRPIAKYKVEKLQIFIYYSVQHCRKKYSFLFLLLKLFLSQIKTNLYSTN